MPYLNVLFALPLTSTTCPSYASGLHLVVPSCSGLDPVELLYLYPYFNAERLEVHWYWSGDFNRPAKLYKDHTIQDGPVDPRYRGRVGGGERERVPDTGEGHTGRQEVCVPCQQRTVV